MYHQKSHHINKDNLIKQLNSYMLTDDFIEKIEFDSEKESNEEFNYKPLEKVLGIKNNPINQDNFDNNHNFTEIKKDTISSINKIESPIHNISIPKKNDYKNIFFIPKQKPLDSTSSGF